MINLLKVRKTQVRGLNCVSFSENLFYVKTNQMIRNISRGREREGGREGEGEEINTFIYPGAPHNPRLSPVSSHLRDDSTIINLEDTKSKIFCLS